MDTLNGDDTCYSWKIDSICFDSKRLSLVFNCCSFRWVKQEANIVAHCLVKFSSLYNLFLCCNHSFLRLSVLEAWLSDACYASDFWMKTHLAKKRWSSIKNSFLKKNNVCPGKQVFRIMMLTIQLMTLARTTNCIVFTVRQELKRVYSHTNNLSFDNNWKLWRNFYKNLPPLQQLILPTSSWCLVSNSKRNFLR